MITMGHQFMAAILAMITPAGGGLMHIRVHVIYRNFTFLPVPVVLVVQVPLVHIIDVVLVVDLGMTAGDAVMMGMILNSAMAKPLLPATCLPAAAAKNS
jgi:hypothetical protein